MDVPTGVSSEDGWRFTRNAENGNPSTSAQMRRFNDWQREDKLKLRLWEE